MIKPFQLKAPVKDYLWGGNKLKSDYGKSGGDVVAESWELSVHPDGCCKVSGGALDGMMLTEVLEKFDVVGKRAAAFKMFPVLIKFIDASSNLSIQVHPSDEYALKNEGQYGKTEMWYIVEAAEGSGIYYGLKEDVTKERFEQAIKSGTVTQLLNYIPVKAGETYFIESGTIHAICGGLIIWELQQNSNLTYRVFDYNRVGADGKARPLHIERAVEVSNLKKQSTLPVKATDMGNGLKKLVSCKYFTAYSLDVDGEYSGTVGEDSFVSLTVVSGSGSLNDEMCLKKGDTVFLPASSGKYVINGSLKGLIATVE